MKSEPFRFSPTSAGVRIEHLDLQNSHNHNNNHKNYCNNNNSTNPNDTIILPRARTPKILQEGEDLQHIIVQNSGASTTGGCGRKRRSNKMRNCIIIAAVTVIISLLSFVLLVECRSLKGSSKKSYDDEKEIAHESRIQEATLEPDAESSEEVPTKVVSTTTYSKEPSSSTQKHSTKRASISTSTSGSGRLTRSRVSVICKGGYLGLGDDEQETSSTTSTSTSPASTKNERRRKHDKELELPTLLPRETDWDDEEENAAEETESGEDETRFNSEETQQVVTVTGYSHVTGGKPETKALRRSSSKTIKYVPKPAEDTSTPEKKVSTTKNLNEDEIEGSSSSEEGVVITVRPKSKSSHHKSKPKASSISHSSHTVITPAASTSTSTHEPSSKSSHRSKKERYHRKRDHSSEENEEELEEEVAHRSSKRTKQSKRSGNNQSKHSSDSGTHRGKNEKGDSGEIEEDALFPTLRKTKAESKRGKKASERRQKPAEVVPVSDPELESAEAEPVPVVEVRKSENSKKKSSRSRSTGGHRTGDNKKEASSLKPVSVKVDSSEEYNMEEMPFLTPTENAKRSKSRRSSSSSHSTSSSSSSRNARMSSKTAAPKLRTTTFSSAEIED
ncbi:unnamed protein product [Orchesella dallaii]|uniref:Uncharacterized protein n=1 Tax=Orchesella dallaii TaxID=48710 RepID=A0ABP1RC49_9HEXA